MRLSPQTAPIVRLRREGNSVVLTIPAWLTRALGVKYGDLVSVALDDETLLVRKVDLETVLTGIARDAAQSKTGLP